MKKFLKSLLVVFCMGVFVFSLTKVVSYYYESFKSEKHFSQLKENIVEEDGKVMTFYEKYRELIHKNSDLVAWIKIEDTKLDYPVMLTPSDEEYYLRRNFDKEYEFRGTPFFNGNVDLKEDDNLIIYAHNMDDGTMFGALRKYTSYDYYKDHSVIQLESLVDSKSEYEIFSVFVTVDDPDHELYIDYYKFHNALNEEDFNQQIEKYKRASYYDTGITPKYGEQLLTLSTCEYSNENGRLVVVARKVMLDE